MLQAESSEGEPGNRASVHWWVGGRRGDRKGSGGVTCVVIGEWTGEKERGNGQGHREDGGGGGEGPDPRDNE